MKKQSTLRAAVLDHGSNTLLLLVADVCDGNLRFVYEDVWYPRVSEGVADTGRISARAIERSVAAVKEAVKAAKDRGAERIYLIGTGVLRYAKGSENLKERVRKETGLEMEIISGETEAKLAFKGTLHGRTKGCAAVVDVGGASTETAFGEGERLVAARSLPLGSVVLTEKYKTVPPVSKGSVEKLEREIFNILKEALPPLQKDCVWFGSSGTFTTLACIYKGVGYSRSVVDGIKLSAGSIAETADRLAGMSVEQIKKLPGMDPMRADVIYTGAEIALLTMKKYNVKEIIVSCSGLREGYLLNRV